jgi:DNA replication protein DnaC
MNNLPETIKSIVDDLNDLKDPTLASALEDLCLSKGFNSLRPMELIEQLFLPVCEQKLNNRFQGRLKKAHLAGSPQTINNCKDSSERAYLPNDIIQTLSSLNFIEEGLNICILGPSDSGKSYLAKALAVMACVRYMVCYEHCENFLEAMVSLKQLDYQKYQKKIRHYIKLDLLVLDDFLLHTITDEREIKVLFEIMEKRNEASRSTIVCSQRDPKSWPVMILNDEVSSNSIMKRATKHYTVLIEPKN